MSERKNAARLGTGGATGENKNSDATSINPCRDKSIPVWEFSDLRWFARHPGRWWRVRCRFVENVTGFFFILAEWARAEMPGPANVTGKPREPNDNETRHER